MLQRLFTAVVALVITSLAIGVPIMLTEAGSSSSRGTSRTLNASYEYIDTATGDRLLVTVYASIDEATSRTNDNAGGGGAGSSRAKSSRTGGGNSTKPHDGGTQTYADSSITVYVDRYDQFGNVISFGDGTRSSAQVSIAEDLSSGSASGSFTFYTYPSDGSEPTESTAAVDLVFTATGPLQTTRDTYSSHVKSPRERFRSTTTITRRNADADGSITVYGLDVAAEGPYYAEIATYDSRSRFTN